MNSRLLVNGRLACLLFLVATGLGAMPAVLRAAGPPGITPVPQPGRENADDPSNPYSVIVERNIFHLNPPPPPPEADKPKVDLPVVKITGFVNIGNKSKVLFISTPKDKKEGPLYYSLAEGEKSADNKFELVKIRPDEVDVINDGVPVTLTLKDDTLAASSGAPAAPPKTPPGMGNPANGMPGRPMFPPGRMGQPGFPGVPGGNGLSSPARMLRTPPQ